MTRRFLSLVSTTMLATLLTSVTPSYLLYAAPIQITIDTDQAFNSQDNADSLDVAYINLLYDKYNFSGDSLTKLDSLILAAQDKTGENLEAVTTSTELNSYSNQAWFYPHKIDCNQACLRKKYFYYALTTALGMTVTKQSQVARIWEPHTVPLFFAIDPNGYAFVTTDTTALTLPKQSPARFYFPPDGTSAPDFDVADLTDQGNYDREITVFGIKIQAHSDVPPDHLTYAGVIAANWLDNDMNGELDMASLDFDGTIIQLNPGAYSAPVTPLVSQVESVINGPNPFNPEKESTVFQYNLSQSSAVELAIYSLGGREVYTATLPISVKGSSIGFNSALTWDGRDSSGKWVDNGVYIAYLQFTSVLGVTTRKCKVVVYR